MDAVLVDRFEQFEFSRILVKIYYIINCYIILINILYISNIYKVGMTRKSVFTVETREREPMVTKTLYLMTTAT